MRGLSSSVVPLIWCLGFATGCTTPATTPGGFDASAEEDASGDVPMCENGRLDPGESDIDCAGPCPPCRVGRACRSDGDCASGRCDAGACAPAATCGDGQKNGDETDVDCGGPACPACAVGRRCLLDSDCTTATCVAGTCAPAPTCDDGAKNGRETDVDCGGGCPPCTVGKGCFAAADCSSRFCVNNLCRVMPGCDDRRRDNAETDVDCGGGACPACANGFACQMDADCLSGRCDGTLCAAVEMKCANGVMDQDETDIDCGGMTCAACGALRLCLKDGDCASQRCTMQYGALRCELPATCGNLKLDGQETDVDCGGTVCFKCQEGKNCQKGSDCQTAYCAGTCQKPTCSDKARNGDEADVDCGGAACARCAPGQACNADSDCLGFTCLRGTCAKVPGPILDFAAPVKLGNGAGNRVVAGDLDADGFLDVVWLHGGTDGPQVDVLFGDGKGGFATASKIIYGYDLGDIGVADFARDGLPDVWVVRWSRNEIAVVPSAPKRAFGKVVSLPVASGPLRAVAGDFNRDGLVDFAVEFSNSQTVRTYLNQNGSAATAGGTFTFKGTPWSLVTVDVDGDRQLDIAVGDAPGSPLMPVGVGVALSGGNGTFAAPVYSNSADCPGFDAMSVADFNRDGRPDVVASHWRPGRDGTCLFLNKNGQLAAPTVIADGIVGGGHVVAGDVDGDGNNDLVTRNRQLFGVLLGIGDGSFHVAGAFGSPAAIGEMLVGDYNGDGKGDVVVAANDPNSASGLFLNLAMVR